MEYVKLGARGPKVSRLGFGCMRLPMGDDGKVDRELAVPMLRRGVELGINYFDSAIFYCGAHSQPTLGEAMEGIRDKVVLSTKNHMYTSAESEWWGRLEESLTMLRTDYIDCYCMHGLSWTLYEQAVVGESGKMRLMQKAKDQGMIRHICCSFHDSAEALLKIIEKEEFDAITLQYNLLDRQLEEAMYRAQELGIGIVVMGPVAGGTLGVGSERIQKLTGSKSDSAAEAALRFVLAHPAVSVALSGMSTMEMLEENVKVVSEMGPLSGEQIAAIDEEVERVKEQLGVPCTSCGYCMPCRHQVDIPANFAVYNRYKVYGLEGPSRGAYGGLILNADACVKCGVCVEKCPQKIDIPEVLMKVMRELDDNYDGFGAKLTVTGATEDGVVATVTAKNVGDEPIEPRVTVELEGGCVCEPGTIELPPISPAEMARGKVSIRAGDGTSAITGKCITTCGGERRETPVQAPFMVIGKDSWRHHVVGGKAEEFGGRQDLADSHGCQVGLRHDDEKISMELVIRSAMQGLSLKGDPEGGRLEMYVDMRPRKVATNNYEFGVEQFLLCLEGTEFGLAYGDNAAKRYKLNIRNERTSDGCRILLDLLFADFMKPEWPRPRVIGLDFMLVATNEEGADVGYCIYGGRGGLFRNPALFTKAFLL